MKPLTSFKHTLLLGTAAVLSLAGLARAEPFDPAQVPASAAWVMHVDVDALRDSRAWRVAEPLLMKRRQFAERRAMLERIAGVKLPGDVSSVLLFSVDLSKNDAVLIVTSNAHPERLKALVALNDTYAVEKLDDGREVHRWTGEDKRTIFATFLSDRRVALSASREQLGSAMDVAAGKSAAVAGDTVIARGATSQPTSGKRIVFVASDQLPEIAKQANARSRLMERLHDGWLSLSSSEYAVTLTGDVHADNTRTAWALKGLLSSASAAITLLAPDAGENPNVELLGQALESLESSVTGQTVSVRWPITYQQIRDEMAKRGLDTSSFDAPATKPATTQP
jgi:hypothetical protein